MRMAKKPGVECVGAVSRMSVFFVDPAPENNR